MLLPQCERSGWKLFLLRLLLNTGRIWDVFGTRRDWLDFRHGLKIGVRGEIWPGKSWSGGTRERPGKVGYEKRDWKCERNDLSWLGPFYFVWSKKEMVSLSRMVRSEMVGLTAGSNLEEMVSSEHLKTRKRLKWSWCRVYGRVPGGW